MKFYKFVLLVLLTVSFLHSKEITDMLGRSVVVPDEPKRVYGPAPFATFAIYAIDPTLLAGWIFSINKDDYDYMHPHTKNLPFIGRIFGGSSSANIEVLMANDPDLVVMWQGMLEYNPKEAELLEKLKTPYIYVDERSLSSYPQIFRFLGEVLSREERGEKLATYAEEIFAKTTKALEKSNHRPKIYYAQGVDGLATECDDSIHVHLLKIAGDVNIHRCNTTSHKGFEKISMERVLEYNPDVILIQDEIFFRDIYNSALWSQLDAVKNRRVYLIPRAPFNWFDRPPSFMRIMGLEWLMHTIYPDEYSLDLQSRTREFYKLFMGVDLSQAQLDHVLKGATSLIKEVDMK